MPREIPLTQGKVAIVDDADFDLVSGWKWFAVVGKKSFYAVRTVNISKRSKLRVAMHRFLAGAHDGDVVDHIDGNGLDNRRSNLRVCSARDNARNIRARAGSSRFKGVSFHRGVGKWQAYVAAEGQRYLGVFDNEIDAALAHDEAARALHGEFARVNFPRPGEQAA